MVGDCKLERSKINQHGSRNHRCSYSDNHRSPTTTAADVARTWVSVSPHR
ncbi:hypothetical protein Hanom_Chr09g00776861 [Helianthus anomalus]